MRVRVVHRSIYAYATPARSLMQVLRMTPRSFDGQHVLSWRVDVDVDCRLIASEDAFGNVTHAFNADGPIARVAIIAAGEVETFNAVGFVRGAVERFPPELYLRDTAATAPDARLRAFTREACAGATGPLDALHALTKAVHDAMRVEAPSREPPASAAEALARAHGPARDLANVFVACARIAGAPARFISGYHAEEPGDGERRGPHAWAEAYVERLGWIGFDPVHCLSTDDRHVRVACALDALGAAPARGVHAGQGETLTATVEAEALDGPETTRR